MRTIETTITVDATPEQAWQVLTDFPAHGEWNPFMRSITGRPVVGEQLEVVITPPGRKASTFRPTVTAAQPARRFEWLGHLRVRGLFDGRHSFELTAADDGTTRLVHCERFTGVLVPLVWRSMVGPTTEGFEQFNEAFARRCAAVAEHA
jgi:hypothetical protein